MPSQAQTARQPQNRYVRSGSSTMGLTQRPAELACAQLSVPGRPGHVIRRTNGRERAECIPWAAHHSVTIRQSPGRHPETWTG